MLLNLLRVFGRKDKAFPDIYPDQPFVAVGDIHGRSDLLAQVLNAEFTAKVVCVGDYIDRGEDSAGVLRMLLARPDVICLSGNHEEMMVMFIDDPDTYGQRWLPHGGLQTLASFGVTGVTETSTGDQMRQARDQLVTAMGEPLLAWVRGLPTVWRSGNVAVTHAGADPAVPIAQQSDNTLRWGQADFYKKQRKDGIWVVHGHRIVDEAAATAGRIAIDTGAYATDRLTVVHVDKGSYRFETFLA